MTTQVTSSTKNCNAPSTHCSGTILDLSPSPHAEKTTRALCCAVDQALAAQEPRVSVSGSPNCSLLPPRPCLSFQLDVVQFYRLFPGWLAS